MSRGSVELTNARKNEIIEACSLLYKEKNYNEITIKDIANATTLTRTALYKYYQTKEEIFLSLLQREYDNWNQELLNIIHSNTALEKKEIAHLLSVSLENRIQLLKLMSMNNFELEAQSRFECVVEYKKSLGYSMKLVRNILDKFCLEMSDNKKERFIYSFFPFTFGLYPYTVLNDKAKNAMDKAQIDFHYYSIYELSYNCIITLLNDETV
ncbi:MAG: TetR family transcriptional regulator [Bacillota bacterium]|nr:TetR family transcriptional regulator [Bacillota bacterium]